MKLLVLGAAASGRAVLGLARARGHDTAVYDRDSRAVIDLSDVGHEVHSGAWNAGLLRDVDLVVTSPGFPEHSAPITDTLAAGVPLWAELEFGVRFLDAPYVAVTGTNGKTTTVEATAAMLAASGMRTVAAGNVGTPVSAIAGEPWDVVVLEASSFQLRFVHEFHPFAGAITNLAPDHLDWHTTFERYVRAKAALHRNMTAEDLLVFDVDDPGVAAFVEGARARRLGVSGRHPLDDGIGVEDGELVLPEGRVRPRLDDPSYLTDLAIAAALALEAGAATPAVVEVASGFQPGEHRREILGVVDGVTWVNDSKATNPHAAVASAEAFPSVVLLAGGLNKGLDLRPMTTIAGVRAIVAFGAAAEELVRLAPATTVAVDDLDTAVEAARSIARPGDTLLLAPGCASFDQFASYAERGERFRQLYAVARTRTRRTS